MSTERQPDLAWIRTANDDVLEEAELILLELTAQFDLMTSALAVAARRKLPGHKQPQAGEADPYGMLRLDVLRMLIKRRILEGITQRSTSYHHLNADEATVRFALAAVDRQLAARGKNAPTDVPGLPGPDLSWVRGCEPSVLRELRSLLIEIKQQCDRGANPLVISAYPPGTSDLALGEDYFSPLADSRWQLVSKLLSAHIVDEGLKARPIQLQARAERVALAVTTIDEELRAMAPRQASRPSGSHDIEDPMNDLAELALHAQALRTAVEQAPEFFASIAHYAQRLAQLTTNDSAALTQRELVLIVDAIDAFYDKWRPKRDPYYIAPRETADTNDIVVKLVTIRERLKSMPEHEFLSMAGAYAGRASSTELSARGGTSPKSLEGSPQSWAAHIREHPVITMIVAGAAVAVATWGAANSLMVEPRNFKIATLEQENQRLRSELVAPSGAQGGALGALVLEAGIAEGEAATTNDGQCTLVVEHAGGSSARIAYTVSPDTTRREWRVEPGERRRIAGVKSAYLVAIKRLRGNIVDLAVYREPL